MRPDCRRLPGEDRVERGVIHFGAVEMHIAERDGRRLCDGKPASGRDISSEDWMEIREARAAATLCPDCQDKLHPLDVQPELYGMGKMSLAHLAHAGAVWVRCHPKLLPLSSSH